jgi:hypothetical protein
MEHWETATTSPAKEIPYRVYDQGPINISKWGESAANV